MKRVLVCLLLCSLSVLARPECLVRGAECSKYDTMAAEELQLFWSQMYGEQLLEMEEGKADGKAAIYLGRTAFAKANGVDSDSLEREEWLVKPVGENLIVTGGRPVGTLYGVYRLLDQLGVLFLAMDTTVVPATPEYRVRADQGMPAFASRVIFTSITYALGKNKSPEDEVRRYQMWRLRNFANGKETGYAAPLYTGKYLTLGQKLQWHSLSLYVDPKLFDQHPEYFAMDKFGVRQKPRYFQKFGDVCMTNPEVKRVAVESLRKMIQENRKSKPKEEWSIVYDLSRLDATPEFCQCPECRKFAEQEGSERILLFAFANHIITEIHKEYPEILLRVGIGARPLGNNNGIPPRTIKLAKGQMFFLTDRMHRDPFHPIFGKQDGTKEQFSAWKDQGTHNIVWDYWNLPNHYFTPPRVETVFDAIKPDLQFFRENNIDGMFIEASSDWVCPQNFMMLNYYVAGRLMVDLQQDAEKLAEQFIRGYYGASAAPMVSKYFSLIREGVRNDPQRVSSLAAGLWKFSTPKFLLEMYQEFQAAIAKESNPLYAMHLRTESIAPIWCALHYWNNCRAQFEGAGVSHERLVEDCRNYSQEYIRRFKYKNTAKGDEQFQRRFQVVEKVPLRPPMFKDVSDTDFRMVTEMNFHCPGALFVRREDDPDSIQGRAVCSANRMQNTHGVDILMPGKDKFRTTQFALSSQGNIVQTVLKQVPQDEKYHWYRIPGRIELKERSHFWGHGWGIQANTSNWYILTYGEAEDNTFDQVWFSAKFTGPAYVPGSTKENAIWVDMAVAVRRQPETVFQPFSLTDEATSTVASGLPAGWRVVGDAEVSSVVERQGKYDVRLTSAAKNTAALWSPAVPCTPADVFQLTMDCEVEKTIVEFAFLDKGGEVVLSRKARLNGLEKSRYILADITTMETPPQIVAVQLRLNPPQGGALSIDNLRVEVARSLNRNFAVSTP